MGVRYEGVENVVARYRALRTSTNASASEDRPGDLVRIIEEQGGPVAFAAAMKNRQLTSPRGGILKAEAVLRAAQWLVDDGVATATDLSGRSPDELAEVARHWGSVPGQGSGISWSYFLMLSGAAGVKADRMIRRFLAEALGRADEAEVSVPEASELVAAAAERLGVSATTLDHQIWLYQRASGVS